MQVGKMIQHAGEDAPRSLFQFPTVQHIHNHLWTNTELGGQNTSVVCDSLSRTLPSSCRSMKLDQSGLMQDFSVCQCSVSQANTRLFRAPVLG